MRTWLLTLLVIGLAFPVHTQTRTDQLPQSKLPTVELTIGTKKVLAEVADEPAERAQGLMFRTALGDNEGMLFVFARAARVTFWMRNTPIPLSIAFLNVAGMIVELHEMKPLDETLVTSSFGQIAYALEMPQHWFAKNNILPGTRVNGLPPFPGKE